MFQTNPPAFVPHVLTNARANALILACGLCAMFSPTVIAMDADAQVPQTSSTSEHHNDHFDSTVWEGEWQAENTLFSLRVVPQGNRFMIEPVSSLGLEWTSSDGVITGNSGTINVEYQGVSAQVLVQLISYSSAIVRSLSCQPDYHVVCTLVRNQQALFVKVQNPPASLTLE